MRSNSSKTYFSIVFVILGFVSISGLSNYIDGVRPEMPKGYQDEDLQLQGEKLKGFAFGSEGLIADWYWVRALQYIGDKILKNKDKKINLNDLRPLNPKLLYPFLDTATTLDPNFLEVYDYGAIVLPAINPDDAIKITEKGIKNNPKKWRLYQHLGYIYWTQKNYSKAAEYYDQGSKIEGSPKFLGLMAAKMKSSGGSRETAISIYENIYNEATDMQIKEAAALRLLQIDSLYEQEAIQKVLDRYKNDSARCPQSLQEIFSILKTVKTETNKPLSFSTINSPLDPTKIPYQLNTENNNCKVSVDTENSQIPVD